MTSAPAGSTVTVGGNPQWLAGCLDFGFIADVPGTYTYSVIYNAGTHTGTVMATAGDTVTVAYSDGGSGPILFNVSVGDVIVFKVGYLEHCADQVYLALTSVPYGAPNPVPSGSGYDLNIGRGPLTYPVTVAGTYSYSINGTSGFAPYAGSITASAATASVQSNDQHSGFSMRVASVLSNGTTTVQFSADKPATVHLALFDAAGKLIKTYEGVTFGTGDYSMPLSSSGLPSGDYYLRALADGAIVATAKILIVH